MKINLLKVLKVLIPIIKQSIFIIIGGDIIAGKINLENGKKYDSLSFYNPKLLKYSIKDIKRSLKVHAFYHTAMRTKNRDYVINSGIGGSYVLLY